MMSQFDGNSGVWLNWNHDELYKNEDSYKTNHMSELRILSHILISIEIISWINCEPNLNSSGYYDEGSSGNYSRGQDDYGGY